MKLDMFRKNILKGNIADGKCVAGVRPALWLKI